MKTAHPLPLLRLAAYLSGFKKLFVIVGFAEIIRLSIPLVVPWSFKIIVDDVLPQLSSPISAGRLAAILGVITTLYVFWALASFVRFYGAAKIAHEIIYRLRQDLFRKLQEMSLDYFEKKRTGALSSRLLHDTALIQNIFVQGAGSILIDFALMLIITGIMIAIHPFLAFLSLITIPFSVATSKFFIRKIKKASRTMQEHHEKLSAEVHEKLNATALIQSFNRQEDETQIFSNYANNYLKAILRNSKLQSVGLSITCFFSAMGPLLMIGGGAYLVAIGQLSFGKLVAFYAYAALLTAPISRLSESQVVIGGALAALERIFEILDTPPLITDTGTLSLRSLKGDISFKGVSFFYPHGGQIFSNFDLEIREGEYVVITGPSGSGKSTLAKLLLRFYDVQRGSISLGGNNIRDLQLSYLRSQIAWVPQEPILFSGSILENILYGRKGASSIEAIQAAKAARAHDFVSCLPQQYETQVGEKGLMLSAGEKQRIAIARAFLKEAPIFILDEPTSALDPTSQQLIAESLRDLRRIKTVLLISHHSLMANEADREIILNEPKYFLKQPQLQ